MISGAIGGRKAFSLTIPHPPAADATDRSFA